MKYLKSIQGNFDAFLCHRREDGQALALALRERLLRKRCRVFMDVVQRKPGPFASELKIAVSRSDRFVVVATDKLLERLTDSEDWVAREIDWARKMNRPALIVAADDDPNRITTCTSLVNQDQLEVVTYPSIEPQQCLENVVGIVHPSFFSLVRSFVTQHSISIAVTILLGAFVVLLELSVTSSIQNFTQIKDKYSTSQNANQTLRKQKFEVKQKIEDLKRKSCDSACPDGHLCVEGICVKSEGCDPPCGEKEACIRSECIMASCTQNVERAIRSWADDHGFVAQLNTSKARIDGRLLVAERQREIEGRLDIALEQYEEGCMFFYNRYNQDDEMKKKLRSYIRSIEMSPNLVSEEELYRQGFSKSDMSHLRAHLARFLPSFYEDDPRYRQIRWLSIFYIDGPRPQFNSDLRRIPNALGKVDPAVFEADLKSTVEAASRCH